MQTMVLLKDDGQDESQERHEFIADSRVQNPEQIYIAKETYEEIHTALQRIAFGKELISGTVLALRMMWNTR